jgi:hypothetical protein
MRKTAMVFAAIALLVAGSAFAQEGQITSRTRLKPLVVVDSTGKVLGRMATLWDYATGALRPTAIMSVNGSLVAIPLTTAAVDVTKLRILGDNRLWFVDASCQGTPNIASESPGLTTSALVTDAAGTTWLYLATGAGMTQTFGSYLESNACVALPIPQAVYGTPLAAPINLSAQFAAPFTIQ